MHFSSAVSSDRTNKRRTTLSKTTPALAASKSSLILIYLLVLLSSSSIRSAIGVKLRSSSAFFRHSSSINVSDDCDRQITVSTKTMAPKSTGEEEDVTAGSSSVLGELKETIRQQHLEIERLRGALKTKDGTSAIAVAKSVSHGGGGHGAGGEPSLEDVTKYLQDPFYAVALKRVGWLGIFLASLSATALIMNVFEETLEKHIELSYFVPLLAGHGGNTGGQTVGTVLSAISAGTVKPSDAPRVILKEAMAGITSGFILGTVVSPIAYKGMEISFHVAVVLFFTIPLVSLIASTLGSIIPFGCLAVGLDPSVIASPAMTSTVDVIGLMSYFIIANHIFRLFGHEL